MTTVDPIVLEPGGDNSLTVINNGDDYNTTTMNNVIREAIAIKAAAHDTYTPNTEYTKSTGPARTIFISLSEPDAVIGLDLKVIKGVYGKRKSVDPIQVHDEAEGGLKDYNRLLSDVDSKYGKQELTLKVGVLQNRINSNSSTNVYIRTDTTVSETDSSANIGNRIIPNRLGNHTKIETVASNANQENRILGGEMQFLGSQIPLKSSGEFYIPKSDSLDEISTAIAESLGGSFVRSLSYKIPVKDLSAKSVLNSAHADNQQIYESNNWPKLEGEDSIKTFGSYNSWMVPFDGLNTYLQIPSTVILVSAIAIPVIAMAGMIDLGSYASFEGSADKSTDKKDRFIGNVMVGFMSLFGLNIEEKHEYNMGYFLLSLATMASTKRVRHEYAWMNIVARKVARELMTGIPAAAESLDFNTINSYARLLTDSPIANFIYTLAELGSNYMRSRSFTPSTSDYDKETREENRIQEFVQKILFQNTLISTARVGNRNGYKHQGGKPSGIPVRDSVGWEEHHDSSPLSWGTGTTPSMYILPETIIKANFDTNRGSNIETLLSEVGSHATPTNRISAEWVRFLEDKLDSSYMPFYIQDLRTNEIISFHAFIGNMTDSFSANYESSTGMGRIEPIHTYKNSSRDMGIDFTIVATNAQDHAEMWWKINKLLTLVYPQFTKGREIGGTFDVPAKFIQPYSQLVGASPMVRIRVGDVWTSNYSKFNVMRLFGLGEPEFSLDNDVQPSRPAMNEEGLSELAGWKAKIEMGLDHTTMDAMLKKGDPLILTIDGDLTHPIDPKLLFPISSLPDQSDPDAATEGTNKITGMSGKFQCTINEAPKTDGSDFIYKVHLVSVLGDSTYNGDYSYRVRKAAPVISHEQRRQARRARLGALANVLGLATRPRRPHPPDPTSFRNIETKLDERTMIGIISTDIRQAQFADTGGDPIAAINARTTIEKFFKGGSSPDANPIIQAFESTAGQGIAGFISSIGIDWNGSTWSTDYEIGNPSRSPQMCKISLKFLPIHDITPGLANNGFMTAPVYSIGKYSNVFKDILPLDNAPGEGVAPPQAPIPSPASAATPHPPP